MTGSNQGKLDLYKKIAPKASIVLREESDDWAILYDPDSDDSFGINPVSVLVWKHLNGQNTIKGIVEIVRENCMNVHEDVENDILGFINELLAKGLAIEINGERN